MLKFALNRPIGVGISLFAALVLGVISYINIPLQLLPKGMNFPFLWVSVPTLSASPEENEVVIAHPIEDALSTLPSIKKVMTFIRGNSVAFGLRLHPSSDANLTYQHIRARLRTELPKLPEGAQFAYIWRHDPNDDPVYVMGVQFPADAEDASRLIEERLMKPIERLKGVSRVEMSGVKPHDVRINIRSEALHQLNIDPQVLTQQLAADHFTLSAGVFKERGSQVWVRVSSRFEDLEALRDRPISPYARLRDVATVEIAPDSTPIINRINGTKAASLLIYKASTANTIEVSEQIQAVIDRTIESDEQLRGYRVVPFFNQGEFILTSLNQIKESTFFGGLIAVCCLWFFLRSISLTIMITSAIPLCLLVTVALLFMSGESLNILSMMGLILSVGMVIDNAIVVLEQISRHRKEGLSRIESAIQGTRGVALAITLATLTTLVVFLPLMMVNDQPMLSIFIDQVGKPVCYGLLISLVIALIHLPTASRFLGFSSAQKIESQPLSSPPPIDFALTRGYIRLLDWVLRRRLLVTLLTLIFFASISYPFGQLDRIDQGRSGMGGLNVHVIGPLNGSYKRLNAVSKEVETLILNKREALDLRALVVQPGWSAEHVRMTLYLKRADLQKLNKLTRTETLKSLLPEIPGYKVMLRRGRGNGGSEEGVTLSVFGPQLSTTAQFADKLSNRIRRLPGVTDADLELPEGGQELRLAVHPLWSRVHHLEPAQIARQMNAKFQERPIGDYMGESRKMEILIAPNQDQMDPNTIAQTLRVPRNQRANQQSLNHLTAMSTLTTPPPMGSASLKLDTPLDGLLDRQRKVGTGKIKRVNRKVHVSIDVFGDQSKVMRSLERFIPQQTFPSGYGIDRGEQFSDRDSNEAGGLFAVLVGVLLVFCIMGILFESFITPLAILFTIPLAFVGSVWMLWATNTPFEVMAIIGGVILVGVVVNNGIVLIDQVQVARRRGQSRDEALLMAAQTRLRPILMTAFTTIGGLIPMTFGDNVSVGIDYRPLGIMVIGGLLSSTILTLVVVPLFYTLLDDLAHLPKRTQTIAKRLSQTPKRWLRGVG